MKPRSYGRLPSKREAAIHISGGLWNEMANLSLKRTARCGAHAPSARSRLAWCVGRQDSATHGVE
jgi:hypothetical protein